MKTVKLHIDHSTKPQTLARELKKKNLQKGDLLTIKSLLDVEMVLLIVLVSLAFLNERKIDYAKVLKDIFGNKDSSEIQKEIADEYGIALEVEAANDADWKQFSKQKLAKAWEEDEPEYDESMVKERNEDYKK